MQSDPSGAQGRTGVGRRGWIVRRTLAAADLAGVLLGFGVAAWISSGSQSGGSLLVLMLTFPFWIVAGRIYDLYDRDERLADHSTTDETVAIFNMVSAGTLVFGAFAWLAGRNEVRVPSLLLFWATAVVCVTASRLAARQVFKRSKGYLQNTVILGQGAVARRVAHKLQQHPEYRVNLLGFVDDGVPIRPGESDDAQPPLLGERCELKSIVHTLDVDRVIVAFPSNPDESTLDTVRDLSEPGLQIDVVPRMFELLGPEVHLHGVEGLPLLGLPHAHLSRSAHVMKRSLDLVAATIGVVLLSPILGAVAIAIRLDSHGPVLFRQERMGQHGHPFTILKFRTMTTDAEERKDEVAHLNQHLSGDARMFKIQDDPRSTAVGRFLRRWSLDELPQLFNVIAGHMSLVGPRPLILTEDAHVDGWSRRRLDLKPGITGLWQVLGRDGIPFGEMLDLDYRYVTAWSLRTDIKLIVRTLPALLHDRHG